jgi:hypothetical protein
MRAKAIVASHVLRVVVGWVRIRVPPGLVGIPDPSHGTKCRPQSEHMERSDLAKGERERESRKQEREGQGLKSPQWDLAWSDWLGSYGSCWLEVGAEGEFKLDLRQDHDPGKQLKGAVRTETYQRHYCQQGQPFWGTKWYPLQIEYIHILWFRIWFLGLCAQDTCTQV